MRAIKKKKEGAEEEVQEDDGDDDGETERRKLHRKDCLHFSICACHPCAGAMLIFSVSFQF